MSKKVNVSNFDDFIKRHPECYFLDRRNQIDFDFFDQDDLDTLNNYFHGVCTDLTLYMQIFGEEEYVEELNKFNGNVFSYFQKSCSERICLKLATLMDPPGSKGKENLSLRRFVEHTRSSLLQKLFDDLYRFYEESGVKNWRNKVLAHSDLQVLSGGVKLGLNFTVQEVDDFVAQIQEFIDWLGDPDVSTDHRVVLPEDADGEHFISKIRLHNESR